MLTPQPDLPALGAETQGADPSAAIAEQSVGTLSIADTYSHQRQPGASPSRPRHTRGATAQTNFSARQPNPVSQDLQTGAPILPPVAPIAERYPSGSQVDLNALFHAGLEATEEELRQIDFIVDFVQWISKLDFLRLHLREPMVGDPSTNCPPAVEKQGIKGCSVYTALFHHLDMETFPCKICGHSVKEDLEDAITHQRVHFRHYPYQCLPHQIQCGERFANQAWLEEHQSFAGH